MARLRRPLYLQQRLRKCNADVYEPARQQTFRSPAVEQQPGLAGRVDIGDGGSGNVQLGARVNITIATVPGRQGQL